MADGRLFDLDDIPEVPLFREPRRAKAARGATLDGRFKNDYPADWHSCGRCGGSGEHPSETGPCPDCLGMGSLKARVRYEAGHRCVRCGHPYIPKGDAAMLDVEPTSYQWSPCDESCTHSGPIRYRFADEDWCDFGTISDGGWAIVDRAVLDGAEVQAEWRILTVHHLDGDKANCRWWNLAALCQRCHLEIQAKVVMERIYPHEHSEWFKPHAAAWYAFAYLGEDLTREATLARMPELLALELAA